MFFGSAGTCSGLVLELHLARQCRSFRRLLNAVTEAVNAIDQHAKIVTPSSQAGAAPP